MLTRLHALWLGLLAFVRPLQRLSVHERAAVEAERRELNCRRVAVLVPMGLVLHAGSLLYFWGVAGDPNWRARLLAIHGSYLLIDVVFGAVLRTRAVAQHAGESFVALYLVYGVLITLNAQVLGRGVEVYLFAALAVALVVRTRAGFAFVALFSACTALLLGVNELQPDMIGRLPARANGVPVTLVAWVLSRAELDAFVRDISQKREIARQRDALEESAATLDSANRALAAHKAALEIEVERRGVQIEERAGEVDVLDRQLRERVLLRARELSVAIESSSRRAEPESYSEGSVIAGRFVIQQMLGRGGMGAVYAALDRVTGQRVALKALATPSGSRALQRFLREVEAMTAIQHPGIARPLHVDVTDDGRLFHVQELVSGKSLDVVLATRGRLEAPHTIRLAMVLADALARAHAVGVVHRDVKPGNIVLTSRAPGLVLIDFGIAKLLEAAASSTRQGAALGTPGFMAPEQLEAPGEVSDRADVYSLGVTAFRALTGSMAPCGSRGFATDLEAARVTAAALAESGVDRGAAIGSWLGRCLLTSAAMRPSSKEVHDECIALATSTNLPTLECLHAEIGVASDTPTTLAPAD